MSSDYQFVKDSAAQDWNFITGALQGTYMGQGRTRENIIASFKGSACFGVRSRSNDIQIACCRVITDGVTYAWLADVVVSPPFRRRKVGSFMLQNLFSEPRFKGIVFHLHTFHAANFYARFGFSNIQTMCAKAIGEE